MRASTNNTVYPNALPSFPFLDISGLSSIVSKLMRFLCDTVTNGYSIQMVLYKQLYLPELNHKNIVIYYKC